MYTIDLESQVSFVEADFVVYTRFNNERPDATLVQVQLLEL